MESAPEHFQPPPTPAIPWAAAAKVAFMWIQLGGALTGLFALADELPLTQPYDNLAEALVVVVPLTVPIVAGLWHRSGKVTLLLLAALLIAGAGFVGFTVIRMMMFAGHWAK